jgi:hypothetical protein
LYGHLTQAGASLGDAFIRLQMAALMWKRLPRSWAKPEVDAAEDAIHKLKVMAEDLSERVREKRLQQATDQAHPADHNDHP